MLAPCAVTVASVSVAVPEGQFTPFERQTFVPETKSDPTARLVPEAVPNAKIVDVA